MSREALSVPLECDPLTIRNYEKGIRSPDPEMIEKLAAALEIQPWLLFKPDGDQAALRMSRSDLLGKVVLLLGRFDETNLLGVLKYLETIVINSEKNEELVRGGR